MLWFLAVAGPLDAYLSHGHHLSVDRHDLPLDDGMYYVHIRDQRQMDALLSVTSISTTNIIGMYWFLVYLTRDDALALERQSIFVKPVTANCAEPYAFKSLLYEPHAYIVKAHESINKEKYGLTPIYKDWYLSRELPWAADARHSELGLDRAVMSVAPIPVAKLLNRYATGAAQASKFGTEYDGPILTSEHKLFRHGLTGKGQIVTVIDSGLDHRHCFFHDPDVPVVVNTTMLNHRKIARYDAFADATDSAAGHGSHVCGSIVGSALCSNCSARAFNGQAPDAKVYFVDAGFESNPWELGAEYDFYLVMNRSVELGVGIMSNSWGFPPQTPEIREMFDEIGYTWPEITMFFAAGNSGRKADTWTPSNSKNVVSVGGVTRPEMATVINTNSRENLRVSIGTGAYEIPAKLLNSESIAAQYLKDQVPNYLHQKVGEGIALVRSQSDVALIPQSAVVVISDNGDIAVDRIPALQVSSQFLSQIESAGYASVTVNFTSEGNGPSYSVASFTSLGPSVTKLIKPDVFAVGTAQSAYGMPNRQNAKQCTVRDGLTQKGGTSMACPNAAGVAVLMRQYFVDGFYPSGAANPADKFIPNAAFMRALLISAAGPLKGNSVIPDPSLGFGIVHASDILVFADDANIGRFGMRVSRNMCIKEFHVELVAEVTLTNSDYPLIVSLAWIDPPTGSGSTLPIYADLDLYVITPRGEVCYGNNRANDEEIRSTQERIRIEKPATGKYQIIVHVPALMVPADVYAAVIVNGPFPHNDFVSNPRFLEFKEKRNGTQCPMGHTGLQCQIQCANAETNTPGEFKNTYWYFHVDEHTFQKYSVLTFTFSYREAQVAIDLNQLAKYGGRPLMFFEVSGEKVVEISLEKYKDIITPGSVLYFTTYVANGGGGCITWTPKGDKPSTIPSPTRSPVAPTESQSPTESAAQWDMRPFITGSLLGLASYTMFLGIVYAFLWVWGVCHRHDDPQTPDEDQQGTLLSTQISDVP